MRDTSSPDCKHKHMLENGAPPDKFGILYTVCYIQNNMILTAGSMFWGYPILVPAINSFFYKQYGSF